MSDTPRNYILIRLEDWQAHALRDHRNAIDIMALNGHPGMIVGQIRPDDTVRVGILNEQQSLQMQRAMNTPEGLLLDGSHEPLHAIFDTGVIVEIANERARQVTAEGWSAEHDDEHERFEMARAASAYAASAAGRYPIYWPWDIAWFKPTNPRRDLIKAAALIVAEIERLDRIETLAVRPTAGTSDA